MPDNLKISEINIYPVKSCAGIALSQAEVVDTGFEHDREWMVVNGERGNLIDFFVGNFITQLQYPKMTLIKTTIISNGVRLEASGMDSIDVPIILEGTRVNTKVWGNKSVGIDQGQNVSDWLSKFLGKKCRLIRMAPDFKRAIKAKYQLKGNEITGFADALPFLLISEESLNELNSKLAEKLPMNRFRPNIVISGGTAFQEDSWKKYALAR